MSSWRQNDVATSFWRHYGVIITSCARWEGLFQGQTVLKSKWRQVLFLWQGFKLWLFTNKKFHFTLPMSILCYISHLPCFPYVFFLHNHHTHVYFFVLYFTFTHALHMYCFLHNQHTKYVMEYVKLVAMIGGVILVPSHLIQLTANHWNTLCWGKLLD